MAYERLMQEAQGMSEAALMEVVRFMKFIKTEEIHPDTAQPNTDHFIRRTGKYRGTIRIADDFDALPEGCAEAFG